MLLQVLVGRDAREGVLSVPLRAENMKLSAGTLLEDFEGREVPPASAAQSLHTTRVLMGGLVCVVCAGGDGAADGAAAGVPPY